MISGVSSSLSGLFAFTKKLSNAANNVANVNTDEYKKTTATIVEDKNSLPRVNIDRLDTPGSIVQETDGTMRELSNVELAEEFPQMMISQRGYEANIKALQIQNETIGSLLDIIG
ncbi:MAG TPA: flagellar basal body rod C-terminal domain-containing protein [Syntrophorhabdaceae bacterium]|nr:flagellar basal body rod C-terminal domain-containing protein [Syntrophorhabdaceae bacterium]